LEKKITMVGAHWQRIVSGFALITAVVCVIGQSLSKSELGGQLYYSTILVGIFGYLFLSGPEKKQESDSPGGEPR
jgi:uncharacterized membrane protein YgaE (UPF0421/DUF939 family)